LERRDPDGSDAAGDGHGCQGGAAGERSGPDGGDAGSDGHGS